MKILAIDPGLAGGLALLSYTPPEFPTLIELESMPTRPRKADGTGEIVDQAVLSRLLDRMTPELVVLERPNAQGGRSHGQKMGSHGAFNFGVSFGIVIGACAKLPIVFAHPSAWKKRMGVPGAKENEPDKARLMAIELYGYAAEQLKRKKDLGRAEALLIGTDYCRQLIGSKVTLEAFAGIQIASRSVPTGYTAELDL